MILGLRIANLVFTLLFALAVVVQYNDPDPLGWMAIYGAAAAACGLSVARRCPRWLPPAILLVAALWAFSLARGGASDVATFFDLFAEWEMKNVRYEEAREMWGLLIVAGWMAVLTGLGLTDARATPPKPEGR